MPYACRFSPAKNSKTRAWMLAFGESWRAASGLTGEVTVEVRIGRTTGKACPVRCRAVTSGESNPST
jgi:hypothetical protein